MSAVITTEQKNGSSIDQELDDRLMSHLGWTTFWGELQQRLRTVLEETRKVRRLLPLFGDERLNPDAIANYTAGNSPPRHCGEGKPEPITVPALPRFVSAQISCEFRLPTAQYGDLSAAKHLITKAAYQVALAEDALLLYGEELDPSQIPHLAKEHPLTQKLKERSFPQVQFEYLGQQSCKLIGCVPKEQSIETLMSPEKIAVRETMDPIVSQILQGIDDLHSEGYYGEYCFLAGRLLFEYLFRHQEGTVPIQELLPHLREGGFGHSPMTPENCGVLWSLGGSTIGLAVPREAHVTFVRQDGDVILSIQERARLIFNEPGAVRTLYPFDQHQEQMRNRPPAGKQHVAIMRKYTAPRADHGHPASITLPVS